MGVFQVAIDGPSGAGKSTVARVVAQAKGITYLDTGAMYRAVGLYMHRRGIDFNDSQAVQSALPACKLSVVYQNGTQSVLLGQEDVSLAIREHSVSELASAISAVPCVREYLVTLQQQLAAQNSCVLDGRDICKHVLPGAKYKFYLTATSQARAQRRWQELKQKGQDIPLETVLADIRSRDYNDSHRATSPLVQAEDATLVDSTNLSIQEVVQYILSFIKE